MSKITNKQIKNMSGEVYEQWTVLNEHKSVNGRTEWLCECSCGRTKKFIWRQNLISGKSKKCKICASEEKIGQGKVINDLSKNRYNELTVIERCDNSKSGAVRYLCKCDCGNYQKVEYSDILRGKVKRCSECTSKMRGTHRMSKTKFYNSWRAMKERCLNKNNIAYNKYGGRGISICEEWVVFDNFYKDMYESYLNAVTIYGEDNISIDRIDVNGDYEPNNCRWANNIMQQNNKTNNRVIDLVYDKDNLFNMCRKYNVKDYRFYYLRDKYDGLTDAEIFEMCIKEENNDGKY